MIAPSVNRALANMAESPSPVLEIRNVSRSFGGVLALDRVSFSMGTGEVLALIGPNGSGKSTLFNCITGELKPSSGSIHVDGANVVGWSVNRIARLGVARTYQETMVFPGLSVRENLALAGQEHQGDGILASMLKMPAVRRHEEELERRVHEALEFTRLASKAEERAGDISYGQRKILALGMALMAQPRLLLLDEPMAAVNPTMIEEVLTLLRELHLRGHTILLVEHNLNVVVRFAQRVVVLESGRKLAEGSAEEVRHDARVIEAYFGAD